MKMKERDYLFDNYKAFLIVLVVVGHFIEVASDDNVVMETTKWIIFSFHMPAFVFISGYFSKKNTGHLQVVTTTCGALSCVRDSLLHTLYLHSE